MPYTHFKRILLRYKWAMTLTFPSCYEISRHHTQFSPYSPTNHSLSVYTHIFDNPGFTYTTKTDIGTQFLIHKNPTIQQSWTPRTIPGFYVELALLQLRCYRVRVPETSAERISDTVAWFFTTFTMPKSSPTTAIAADAQISLLRFYSTLATITST